MFNQIFQFQSTAQSLYHGMTLQLSKRMSHHFSVQTAYTWPHAIDDAPDATAVVSSSDLNNDGNRSTERPANQRRNAFRTPAFVSLDPRVLVTRNSYEPTGTTGKLNNPSEVLTVVNPVAVS
jgi:hypothetical protein